MSFGKPQGRSERFEANKPADLNPLLTVVAARETKATRPRRQVKNRQMKEQKKEKHEMDEKQRANKSDMRLLDILFISADVAIFHSARASSADNQ